MITHFPAILRTQIIISCGMQYAVNDIKSYLPFKKTVLSPCSYSLGNISTDEKFQPDISGKDTFHIIKITESYHICRAFMPDIFHICLCHRLIIKKDNIKHPVGIGRQRRQNCGIFDKSLNFYRIRPDAALWQLPRISRFHLHFHYFRLYDMQCVRDAC